MSNIKSTTYNFSKGLPIVTIIFFSLFWTQFSPGTKKVKKILWRLLPYFCHTLTDLLFTGPLHLVTHAMLFFFLAFITSCCHQLRILDETRQDEADRSKSQVSASTHTYIDTHIHKVVWGFFGLSWRPGHCVRPLNASRIAMNRGKDDTLSLVPMVNDDLNLFLEDVAEFQKPKIYNRPTTVHCSLTLVATRLVFFFPLVPRSRND